MLEGYSLRRFMSGSGEVKAGRWTHQAFPGRQNLPRRIGPLGMGILRGELGQRGDRQPGPETNHHKQHLRQSLGQR